MRLPFRFFRGELNGYYIRKFLLSRNDAIADILAELAYQARMVWKLRGETTEGEDPIRDSDLLGIARTTGVNRPIQYLESTVGSIKPTESKIVNGKQRSERGLYSVVYEDFVFVRTANDGYADDIVTEATSTMRMSLVPHGQAPVGYVPYGTDIFDAQGNLIPGRLLSAPPQDGTPYTEYYGDKFLFFEEVFHTNNSMSIDMFKAYYECIARLRRVGSSFEELMYLTELFGEGYIYMLELVPKDHYYILRYSLDTSVLVPNRSGRFAAWQRIVEKRFPDLVVTEREA